MAYQKIGFKNGNVLTAEQLIHMEDGIINAEKKAGAGTPGAGTPGGTGTGLPSDVGAYKYMATDGNGEWVPADRLAWIEQQVLIEEQTVDLKGGAVFAEAFVKPEVYIPIENGKAYVLSLDRVQYESKLSADRKAYFDTPTTPGWLTIVESLDDTQEYKISETGGSNFTAIIGLKAAPSIHPISPEYLPEGIGYKEAAETLLDLKDYQLNIGSNDFESGAFDWLEEGKTYNVTIKTPSGETKNFTPTCELQGDGASLGFFCDYTGDSYLLGISYVPSTGLSCISNSGDSGIFSVTVIGEETTHPIPAEYLPTTFVPTAVIKASNYDNALAGVATVAGVAVTYECVNMTFEEAYNHVANGGALMVVAMYVQDAGGFPVIEPAPRIINVTAVEGEPTLGTVSTQLPLFWKESGITLADM